jgi:hypothetical protein
MLRRDPTFSDRRLGFQKFLDFLREGERRGRFYIFPDDDQHPRISVEPPPSDLADKTVKPAVSGTRLRADLWSTIVTWDHSSARYWDRTEKRAIMLPLDSAGQPLWVSEPARFARIEPVSFETQVDWMREFSMRQDEVARRDLLLSALEPGAKLGSFRTALQKLGLSSEWLSELQSRVLTHASNWARAVDLPQAVLYEGRRRRRTSKAESPVSSTAEEAGSALPAEAETAQANDAMDGVQDLRARLHRAIDAMSARELADISVPVGYLFEI